MADEQSTVEYRDIPGHPGYRVGNDGSVWSRHLPGRTSRWGTRRLTDDWRQLKPNRHKKSGYLWFRLGRKQFMAHTLVLTAFVGPRPDGMITRHFPNADRTDNRLCNLQWGTRLENKADELVHGTRNRGERSGTSKLTEQDVREILRLATTGLSAYEVAERFGIHPNYAADLARGGSRWSWFTGPIIAEYRKRGVVCRLYYPRCDRRSQRGAT